MNAPVALFDARPFFEQALHFGLQHGLLNQAKLDAFDVEAPKGMVQIARYFGSEFLRPDLERARERLVNLVSLALQHSSQGDLRLAAESLRDNTLLSRSKAGSDMLKALIVMPQNSHFGMNERGAFNDRHIPQLERWSLLGYADYQAELAQRSRAAQTVEAAFWLASQLGLAPDDLHDAEPDAEAVIRTALLAQATRQPDMPDWVTFEKMIQSLRKKTATVVLAMPADLPAPLHSVVQGVLQSVHSDLPKIIDPKLPIRKLFDQLPAFMGRYFWLEDALSEVDQHDRNQSAAWQKLTQGHTDDSTVLTLLLCIAAGTAPKALLSDKAAATLVRKIRKSGLQAQLGSDFIRARAPEPYQSDFEQLWQDFVAQAQATLLSDHDAKLSDALALLRHECNIQ
jgi:hypothetical protein